VDGGERDCEEDQVNKWWESGKQKINTETTDVMIII